MLFFVSFVSLWLFPSYSALAARDAPIALTFDLGSEAAPVPAILTALRAAHVRATFFVTGRWAAAHPLLLRRIVADGHALGNHSDKHADLTRLSDTRIAGELLRAEARVRRACGRSTRPLFRPPFGACDARVRRIAAALGYRVVLWSVDAHDSVKEHVRPADIEDRVMMRARPGGIVLLHGGSPATAVALPRLLRALRGAGYRLVLVSEVGAAGTPENPAVETAGKKGTKSACADWSLSRRRRTLCLACCESSRLGLAGRMTCMEVPDERSPDE